MNKIVLLTLVGSLAFLTEGCSYFSDFAKARKELEKETVKPVPVKVNTAQNNAPATEDEEIFADLEEEGEEVAQAVVGLIPATNPDVRVRGSVRGRNDPFSVVTLNPRIEIEEREEKQVSNNRGNRTSRAENPTNNRSNSDRSNTTNLPKPPQLQPTLAKNVVVSGLFEANGRTRIIVQAPEEASSRYVEVGQYLSNGQILVKSIDKDHFPTPRVILEEAGIEVAKTIGGNLEEEEISSSPLTTPDNQAWVSNASFSPN